ncbi:hypothetical protein [Bdellovibrio bacteriovorus]|uniref:hypothetical protein n=1 Tax=Bdellovibrio bacteriovorus TaxID=959 RepID=UPI0035A58600
MSAKKAIFSFFGFSMFFTVFVIGFTLWRDPYCNNCSEIDVHRYSVNSYYEVAQILKANPDAEVIIVGTSRGQGFSPEWLSRKLGKKVLNLAVAGSSAEAKIAFIELAKKMIPLKMVIWQADYYEILGDSKESKLHAMKLYSPAGQLDFSNLKSKILLSLDHSNFDAAIALGNKKLTNESFRLGVDSIVSENCFKDSFAGSLSEETLKKEVQLMYYNYTKQVFIPKESRWKKDLMLQYLSKDIGVDFVVAFVPYHPDFTKQLQHEYPEIMQRHLDWINDLQKATGKVQSYINSIEQDDGSPKYWKDGTHFTCYASYLILQDIVSKAGLIQP